MLRISVAGFSALISVTAIGCSRTMPLDHTVIFATEPPTEVQVYSADTAEEWTKGLGDIPELYPGEGMVFLFDQADTRVFWMKDVEYPIDIIWIKQGAVVGWVTAQPEAGTDEIQFQRYASPGPVDTVVEAPAGFAQEIGLQIGDTVRGVDG